MPDIYSIAMELNLDDKASAGLHSITGSLEKLVEQIGLATEGFKGFSVAVIGGAGMGIVLGLTKISGAANELTKGLTQMRLASLDTQRAMDAINLTIAGRPGVTREDAMARLRMLLPQLGPAAYTSLLGLTQQEEQFRFMGIANGLEPAVQAARARGITDPAQIQQFVETYLRITQATQGQVTPQMLASIQRRGGAAAAAWSPEFLEVGLPAFLLSGAGLGGRQNLGMALERLDQALLGPGGVSQRGGFGGAVNRRAFQTALGRPLTAQDEQLLATDPARWARTVGSQLESMYGEGHMADVIKRLFTNPVVQQAMLFWMTTVGAQAMDRQRQAFAGALGTTPAGMAVIDKDPTVMLEQVRSRFKNLMDQIALANQPEYVKQLGWIDSLLASIQRFMTRVGPERMQVIIAAFEGIGAALAGVATVAGTLIAVGAVFGPAGLITLAIAGIAVAITTLAALKWDVVSRGLNDLYVAIRNFLTSIGLVGYESQQGPLGNAPAWVQGAKGMMYRRLGELPLAGGFDYVDRNFPTAGELGARGQPITAPQQVPSWLPQFLPAGDPHKGKDVNVSVDLNLDGRLIGNVLVSKVLDDYEFSHGAAAANPHTAWPDPGSTPQTR
jgi:hypothetical protein